MTLIFQREVEGAATHAFVIGCGRYPHLAAHGLADRLAPAAGAIAIANALIASQDTLVAPLGSIELLISNPADQGAHDVSSLIPGAVNTLIDAADAQHFTSCGDDWLQRIKAGDTIFFYFSGHGVVDRQGDAVGLLEDVNSKPNRKWFQSFNVQRLIQALETHGAHSAWVFFDACQEISKALNDNLWTVNNINLKEVGLHNLMASSCQAVAMAGSQIGDAAWAPNDDQAPFFTQLLIKGLSGCCVEKTKEHGWAVTGRSIIFDLQEIAKVLIDDESVAPLCLAPFQQRRSLLKVAKPFVPLAVSSEPMMHFAVVNSVTIQIGETTVHTRMDDNLTWHVDVDLNDVELTIHCHFQQHNIAIEPHTFIPELLGHRIVLKPAQEHA